MNVYAMNDLKRLLEENSFFFKKTLGQNFLMNEAVAKRIAEASRSTIAENVPCLALEIGPGAGSLTLQLSYAFDRVLAIEIDPHIIPVLESTLENSKNVSVICEDALRFDYKRIREEYPGYAVAVCSNLPYCITSEIIMKLLESDIGLTSITVLIQQEAAERLIASPGSPQYGAITAAVEYYAQAKILFRVGPGNFYPRPKVDSAVLLLIPRKEPVVRPKSPELFFKIIKGAFSARRKTILNALSISFSDIPKDSLLSALNASQIDPIRRGETLTLKDFAELSDSLQSWEDLL